MNTTTRPIQPPVRCSYQECIVKHSVATNDPRGDQASRESPDGVLMAMWGQLSGQVCVTHQQRQQQQQQQQQWKRLGSDAASLHPPPMDIAGAQRAAIHDLPSRFPA